MLQSILNFFKVSRGKFFVYVASETKNAHNEWISYFKRLGFVKVDILEEADYCLVFCPVKSRIKTDIEEALKKSPEGKPVILVMMHHTFNPNTITMESRRQVTQPDVCLTVDCLFYEGKLLSCNLNSIARNQIQKYLRVPAPERFLLIRFMHCLWNKKLLVGGLFTITVAVVVINRYRHSLKD